MRKLNLSKATFDKIVDLSTKVRNEDPPMGEDDEPIQMSRLPEFLNPSDDRVELHRTIKALPREQMEELAALVWFGRGYEEFDKFDQALEYAKNTYTNPDETAGYIGSKPLFKYLPHALERLRASDQIEFS